MGTIATFTTAYLQQPPNNVLPPGDRQQVAGVIYAAADRYARGATGAPPDTPRTRRVLHAGMRDSLPYQATLVSDYLAITGP